MSAIASLQQDASLSSSTSGSGKSTPKPIASGSTTPFHRASPPSSTNNLNASQSTPGPHSKSEPINHDDDPSKSSIPPGDVLEAEIAQAFAAKNRANSGSGGGGGVEVEAARPVPTTFMSSLGEWWRANEDEGRVAELRLLSRLPFFTTHPPQPSTSTSLYATVSPIPISSTEPTKRYLNCVTFSTPALDLGVEEDRRRRSKVGSESQSERMGGFGTEKGKEDGTDGILPSERATVLLHGYGAGLCFFYKNFESLAIASTSPGVSTPSTSSTSTSTTTTTLSSTGSSSSPSFSGASSSSTPPAPGRRLFALDWLGMGRSARVPPRELLSEKGKKASTEERVEKAEAFFVESLDRWREEMGLRVMTLVGHSLGGYLSAAYALKYPHRVDRLILLSPAGIPDHTDQIGPAPPVAATPEAATAAARELTESQKETTSGASPNKGGVEDVKKVDVNVGDDKGGDGKAKKDIGVGGGTPKNNGRAGRLRPVFTWMWEQGWSPFGVLRSIGPLGPLLAGRYSSRRFAALGEEDIKDMHSYIWHITRMKGSSEYCISHLLAPGAYARMPIVNRIDKLKIPVLFAYGDRDWMDPEGGRASIKNLKAAGNKDAELYIIRNAGHHLYLDNSESSNKMLAKAIKEQARLDAVADQARGA